MKRLPIVICAGALAAGLALQPLQAQDQAAMEDQTMAFFYSSYRIGEICSQRLGTYTADELALAAVAIEKYLDSAGISQPRRAATRQQVDDGMPELVAAIDTPSGPQLEALCTRVSQVLGVMIAEQKMAKKLGDGLKP